MVQWLGYNKELKRLVVETTQNQVCEIFGSQRKALQRLHFIYFFPCMVHLVYLVCENLWVCIFMVSLIGILYWICKFVIIDNV